MNTTKDKNTLQSRAASFGSFLYNHKAIAAIAILYIIMVIYTISNSDSQFFTGYSQTLILRKATVNIIVACGVTFAVMVHSIDLSIGGMLSLSGILCIKFMEIMPVPLAIICTICIGLFVGFINGFLIVHQKLEGFIITLGMGILLKGIALQITDAHPISADLSFNELAMGTQLTFGMTKISNMIIIMIIIVAALSLVLRYTSFGRNIYAIGGDYAVAEYAGIPAVRQKWMAFVLSAGFTTVAGIINSSYLGAGNANYGDMTAMIVNCAVVVGGTSMAGGIGGIWQSAIGVLFFAAMEITLQNIVPNAYVIQLIQGFIIVAILFLDSYDNKRKREKV